ncbi:MAG TPA: hypothetical protein VLB84_02000 [Bacteroidia bacterium]|nr:hypothetical protein [Bacteroidia bacterium]
MKTYKVLIMGIMALLFLGCEAQNSKKDQPKTIKKGSLADADTLNKPKIQVNVNRKYDDKGNVVQFDSTYSYFYKSPTGKGTMKLNNDSLYDQFQSFFNNKYEDFFDRQKKDVFFNDSLFKYDFFNDDYFLKRFKLNQKSFEDMYKQMDSIKQNFIQKNYPEGYQKKTSI